MSSLSLEDGEKGSEASKERGGLKFGQKHFGANDVIVATVSMSMEQSEELRYVTPVIDNDAIGSNFLPTRMLSMSRRQTRRITTTAATFKSGDSPLDIGIEVVFGDKPIYQSANLDVVTKPNIFRGAGKKVCKKRRSSTRKYNSEVTPTKKQSPNDENDSTTKINLGIVPTPNYNEIDNDMPCMSGKCVPRKKLVRKANRSSKNTESCNESTSLLKAKPIKKNTPTKTRKGITRKLNQNPSYEELEKVINSPPMAVDSPRTENNTSTSTLCKRDEHFGKIRDLCKFYIQHQCVKGNDCDHMHEDFPCKYYYLGLKCNEDKDTCKLSHGGPLATDVLQALGRHIVSDPVELVGKQFIEEVRLNKTPQELVSLLNEFQAQLRGATQNGSVEVDATKELTTDDKLAMRKELYFLTEEQIDGLQALNVRHTEQVLQLTLWQLNSIGINKATQLEAILDTVLNGQDVKMRESPQPLKSSSTDPLQVHGDSEANAGEQDDEQPLIIDENQALETVEEEEVLNNKCVEVLQLLCQRFIEKELRTATKKIGQRLRDVKSSNIERAQKKIELIYIMDQLKKLKEQDNMLKNNTTTKIGPPTSTETTNEDQHKQSVIEEPPDNSKGTHLSGDIKDQFEIKNLGTNVVASSDMDAQNINTVEDEDIEVGEIIQKSIEAEILINKKNFCRKIEFTDEKDNRKSASEADDVVKMTLRSQRKGIQSENTKSVSIDQNGGEVENITPKKETFPCNIKLRRLKLPKQEKATERNNSKKTFSDKTSIIEIEPINRTPTSISGHTNDWEDCIEEAKTAKQAPKPALIISPFKELTKVNLENREVLGDLRHRLEEKKNIFNVKDNFFRTISPLKDSSSFYGDVVEPRFQNYNLNKKGYANKYNKRHTKHNKHTRKQYNRFESGNLNKFSLNERSFSEKYNSESRNDFNKYAEKGNVLYPKSTCDKYPEQNIINKTSMTKSRLEGNSYNVSYDSDEDWDKEESINTNNNNNNNTNRNSSSSKVVLAEPNNSGLVPESPDEDNVENQSIHQSNMEMKLNKEPIHSDWDSEISSPTFLPENIEIASPTYPSINHFSGYTPAMEIDAHMTFPPVPYCLHEVKLRHVEVNNPHSLDKLLRSNSVDPRLLKHKDKYCMHTSNVSPMLPYITSPQPKILHDPRRRKSFHTPISSAGYQPQPDCCPPAQSQKPNMVLYNYLQRSPWYQRLMTTMKMQINHSIAELVRALNTFHQQRLIDSTAVFDVFKIDCAGELLEIMRNIGIFIDSNGVIMEGSGLGQYRSCPAVERPIPMNATYNFIPQILPTPNPVSQSTCSMLLPNLMPVNSFVSCYVDPPRMPLTPRRHTGNESNVITTPPPTEDDEEEHVSCSATRYFKNSNNYRHFEMGGGSGRRDRSQPMWKSSDDCKKSRDQSAFQRRH